jgi:LacI family transcriptional regulator
VDTVVAHAIERTVRAIDDNKRSRRKLVTPVAQPRGSVGPPRAD